jgi:hypothetical protein
VPDPNDDNDDDDELKLPAQRRGLNDHETLMLMLTRVRDHTKRIRTIEKKQGDMDALLNKVLGGVAIVTGVAVFLGWLLSVFGEHIAHIFGRG